MRIKWLESFPKVVLPLMLAISLGACDNTSVYGSIGVGVGVGSSGFNHHSGSNRRMHGSISIGGRIR